MPARALMAFSLIMTVVALAFFVAGIMYMAQGEEMMATAFLLIALVLTSISWAISKAVAAAVRRVPLVRSFEVSTELICPSCGFREVRAFKKGDYVFKPMGRCPKCGSERYITAIYREEGTKPTGAE